MEDSISFVFPSLSYFFHLKYGFNLLMSFVVYFQIHLGSFASDESNLYRKIELRHLHRFSSLKNVLICEDINKDLLELIFKKYVRIYKKSLMSKEQVDRKEIRTEYYNDFDVCLREFNTHHHRSPSCNAKPLLQQHRGDDDDYDTDDANSIKLQQQQQSCGCSSKIVTECVDSEARAPASASTATKRKKKASTHMQKQQSQQHERQHVGSEREGGGGGNFEKRKMTVTAATIQRELLTKEDYHRRLSWNEAPKRSQRQHLFKIYTVQGDNTPQVTATYSKAKEDCDKGTMETATKSEGTISTK